MDTAIVRIFNSILADEKVLYDDGLELRHETVQELADRIGTSVELFGYTVPAFNTHGAMAPSEASFLVGHPTEAQCFRVTTGYGRKLAVTGDHSVFRRGADGEPEAKPVRELAVGDRIAIAGRLDVIERERKLVSLVDLYSAPGHDRWAVAVTWPGLGGELHERRDEAVGLITARSGRTRQSSWGTLHRWREDECVPLAVVQELGINVPAEARMRRYSSGAGAALPVNVEISDQLLWLFGLFVAEGCLFDDRPKSSFINISCDDATLDIAEHIIRRDLGLHVVRAPGSADRGPALFVHSHVLVDLWRDLGLGGPEKAIPGWILGLPLSRLKWFIEGYRVGDGVHSGKKLDEKARHEFSTTSERLKDDLVVALARFGLVPSVGRYTSTFQQRTGDRRYPFWRLTLCHVSPWSPLEWDDGVEQELQAQRFGDLVWAPITAIEPVDATPLVYDFVVPGKENFWAGTGVMAHNTYGERMRPDDGRAIPTFVDQALHGKPITVHGTGKQTRSITYVGDLVRGILLLLDSGHPGPVNCGTEHEMTMRELAERIVRLTGSSSEIIYTERGADDPEKRRPDLTLARELLGYEPQVGPDEGLGRAIDYFRGRLPG
ncbi:NAD-dependent epimerase/dehydratase family protein [Virgisporangium aliadipatigenens]|uniref:NAD-dependent epimerase/dehydratase family protein n=1 Tax=Virgisporangium aliadipatigenens TaxID=741659 RepID=UPI00357127D6